MPRVRTGVRRGALLAMVLLVSTPAVADVFRSAVVVEKPVGLPSAFATNMVVDAAAQRGLVEQYLDQRLSATLLGQRGDDVRTALDPIGGLLVGFKVVSRTDVPENRVRVVCEAEVDAAALVLRLVENRVLSFGQRAPRLLLIPAPGTAPETLTALRGRMTEILGASGITVVAGEAVALPGERAVARRPGEDRIAPARAAVEAGAHFVAVTSVSAARAPTPVGGVVLDATIQYTLMRVYDAAIVGERVFTARGGGVSAEMALQRVLAEVAPMAARGLAGKVAESLFSNGRVVDMSLQPGTITVNVLSRPNPAATTALLDFLRERGFRAALGPGRQAPLDRVAVERVVIHGRASVEELYTLFAVVSFGSVTPLRASVFEYGADSLGIEILDQAAVPMRQAVALGKTEPVRSPSDPPPATVAVALATPAVQPRQQAPQTVRQAQLKPQRVATPLEFEFSEAFEAAMVAGKISVK